MCTIYFRKEIHHIFQAAVVRSFNIVSFVCTSYLAALSIFATHYARGKPLNATNVFSTLALLQVVRFSVTLFLSLAVQFYSEAAASAKRIQVSRQCSSALEYESRGRGLDFYSGHFHSHKLSRLIFQSCFSSSR